MLLHLGPGLANGLANLHNARRAGSPVVVIVGQMVCGEGEIIGLDGIGWFTQITQLLFCAVMHNPVNHE